jgi:hypothetical protein
MMVVMSVSFGLVKQGGERGAAISDFFSRRFTTLIRTASAEQRWLPWSCLAL